MTARFKMFCMLAITIIALFSCTVAFIFSLAANPDPNCPIHGVRPSPTFTTFQDHFN